MWWSKRTYASWYTELTLCNRVVRKTALLGRLAKKRTTLYATQRLIIVSFFLIASTRVTCLTNRTLRDAMIPPVHGEKSKLRRSALCAFMLCLHHRSICSCQCYQKPSVCSLPSIRRQVSHPCQSTSQVTAVYFHAQSAEEEGVASLWHWGVKLRQLQDPLLRRPLWRHDGRHFFAPTYALYYSCYICRHMVTAAWKASGNLNPVVKGKVSLSTPWSHTEEAGVRLH